MDGKANKEGGAFERKSLRRPQFAPGQDALLDSAPPSESLAQAFSTNPAAIRARKAREESRAQHGPPVKGPQAPAITGRVRVVATTNAASPGVAALHNGRTGVVTKRAAGWIEVQLDATRDKPSETIPCRNRDLFLIPRQTPANPELPHALAVLGRGAPGAPGIDDDDDNEDDVDAPAAPATAPPPPPHTAGASTSGRPRTTSGSHVSLHHASKRSGRVGSAARRRARSTASLQIRSQ